MEVANAEFLVMTLMHAQTKYSFQNLCIFATQVACRSHTKSEKINPLLAKLHKNSTLNLAMPDPKGY
jgi:hypothetical protein